MTEIRNKTRIKVRQSRAGFTLLEALGTIMLVIILMGVSFVGYARFEDASTYKKYNETAETVFTVLQAELSEYQVNGHLGDVTKRTQNNSDILALKEAEHLANFHFPAMSYETLSGVHTEVEQNGITYAQIYSGFDTTTGQRPNALYSVMLTPADWAAYAARNGSDAANLVYGILDDCFLPGDMAGMFEGSYLAVEFDPVEGLVYSVFYSHDPVGDSWNYDNAAAPLLNRTREARYERGSMVGYFGVRTLGMSTSLVEKKPVIQKMRLNNGDTLNLTFGVNLPGAVSQLQYSVSLYDSTDSLNDKNPLMEITLNKETERLSTTPYSIKECDVKLRGSSTTTTLKFPVWIDRETDQVVLVLDALDLETANSTRQTDYAAWANDRSHDILCERLKDTFSVYRLGLDIRSQLVCTVSGSGVGYRTTAAKSSNAEYPSFANVRVTSGVEDTVKYSIENARHFYNLRFEEAAAADYPDSPYNRIYTVAKSFSWCTFKAGNNLYHSFKENYGASVKLETPSLYPLCADGDTVNSETVTWDFPSFMELSSYATLRGDNSLVELSDFTISREANVKYGVPAPGAGMPQLRALMAVESLEKVDGTGLFLKNAGAIQALTLKDVHVKGQDVVGAFCAINSGTLYKLKITATTPGVSSVVSGERYVGGIMGKLDNSARALSTDTVTMSNLTNWAKVKGEQFVGGVVGYLAPSGEENIALIDCQNYGAMEATKNDSAYLGGIVGMAADVGYNSGDTTGEFRLRIKNCTSSPRYSASDLLDENYCKGTCVGGIVGLGYNVALLDCGTNAPVSGEGYIVGNKYVGGIAGLYIGSGIIGSTDTNKRGINAANVIGNSYVGGVVGCNANVEIAGTTESTPIKTWITEFPSSHPGQNWYEDLDYGRLQPVTESRQTVLTICNWENKGRVVAMGDYAGGITGYNTGWILNSISNVRGGVAGYLTNVQNSGGDYAGGIVGYNNGIVGNRYTYNDGNYTLDGSSTGHGELSVVCQIAGKNFVGGVVGYNDVDAIVENYAVAGGIIEATGTFVGGYAGLNCSTQLLAPDNKNVRIRSNPNEVKGKYCVGGVIGGNILPVNKYIVPDEMIQTNFDVDNFRASINGTAVVGGFIGYNELVRVHYTETDHAEAEKLRFVFNKTVTSLADSMNAITDVGQNAIYEGKNENSLLHILNNGVKDGLKEEPGTDEYHIGEGDPITLKIRGTDKSPSTANVKAVTADICVSGVVGYNESDTYLTLANITNKIPVIAENKVSIEHVPGFLGSGVDKDNCSLAGGIIGLVTKNTVIDNCSNSGSGDVTSAGDYVGGLAEISLGIIQNCAVPAVGNRDTTHAGGLTAINYGTISGAKSTSASVVTGKEYVGALASENYGKITIEGGNTEPFRVNASGNYAGALAGFNGQVSGKQGSVELASGVNVQVEATGDYVGGLIGKNDGGDITVAAAGDTDCSVKGTVSGDEYVGGVVGMQSGGTLSGLANNADVVSNNGYAGGIAGTCEGTATISKCVNGGRVSSTSGSAAGVLGENSGLVDKCANYGSVSAPKGNAGGIVVVNKAAGTIQNCAVHAEEKSEESGNWWSGFSGWLKKLFGGAGDSSAQTVSISGNNRVGGIAAENTGTIASPSLHHVVVSNAITSPLTSMVGGVAGYNDKGSTITLSKVSSFSEVVVEPNVNGQSAGGIAAENEGTIQADSEAAGYSNNGLVTGLTIGTSAFTQGNLGVVCGINREEGKISNITVKTEENPISDTLYGIGKENGSGYGYGGVAGKNFGKVKYCAFNGELCSLGSTTNMLCLGGIVGMNQQGGEIFECVLGNLTNTTIKSTDSAYLGGICGVCYGAVRGGDNYKFSKYTVAINNNRGSLGGIVGALEAGGSCTGYKDKADNDAIHYLTTGEYWSVTNHTFTNDDGDGGVIGCSFSGEDIRYIKNYAKVQNVDKYYDPSDNYHRGGIVGELRQVEKARTVVSDCKNYGNVVNELNTSGYSAGIVARVRFNSAEFYNCVNYGNIKDTMAGGIVASTKLTDAKESLYFQDCINRGNITACLEKEPTNTSDKYYPAHCRAGGIYGGAYGGKCANIWNGKETDVGRDPTPDGVREFVNCVNTGTVINDAGGKTVQKTNDYAGGISGSVPDRKKDDNGTKFTRCRNYGEVLYRDGENLLPAGGMSNKNVKSMVGCFDFRDDEKNSFLNMTNSNNSVGKDSFYNGDYKGLYGNTEPTDANTWNRGKPWKFAQYTVEGDENNHKGIFGVLNTEGSPVRLIPSETPVDELDSPIRDVTGHTYEELETEQGGLGRSLMEQFYIDYYPELTKTEVKTLTIVLEAGQGTVTWDALDGAYGYRLCYTVVANDGKVKAAYTSEPLLPTRYIIEIPSDDSWSGCKLHVYVRAMTSGKEEEWTSGEGVEETAMETGSPVTNWTAILNKKIGPTLPAPKFHFELGGRDNKGNIAPYNGYVAVLDNIEDYLDMQDDWENIVISFVDGRGFFSSNPNNGENYIRLSDAKELNGTWYIASASKIVGTVGSDQVSGQAKCLGKADSTFYLDSVKTVTLTRVYGVKEHPMGDPKMMIWLSNYQYGTLPNELQSTVRLYHNGHSSEYDFYIQGLIQADMEMEGYRIHDLVLSAPISHLNQSNKPVNGSKPEDVAVNMTFNNLPENLLAGTDFGKDTRSITIQTYLWEGQNHLWRAGHDVATDLSIEQVKDTVDYLFNQPVCRYDPATKLLTMEPGYLLILNYREDGTPYYTIRYSNTLAHEKEQQLQKAICRRVYKITPGEEDVQITDSNLGTTATPVKNQKIYPAPEIESRPDKKLETEGNKYQVEWDKLTSDTGSATYEVQIFGIGKGGERPVLAKVLIDGTNTDEAERNCRSVSWDGENDRALFSWQYTFVDASGAWANYDQVQFRVTRVGSDAVGYTNYLPNYSESEVLTLKRHFSKISTPRIEPPEDPNDMVYGMSWGGLPEEEKASIDFAAYEIEIRATNEENKNEVQYRYLLSDGSMLQNGMVIRKTKLNKSVTLPKGTMLKQGTVLGDAVTINGTNYEAGALTADVTLTEETAIPAGSALAPGSMLKQKIDAENIEAEETPSDGDQSDSQSLPTTLSTATLFRKGSTLSKGSQLNGGTVLSKGTVIPKDSFIAPGTVLPELTVIPAGSYIGKATVIPKDTVIPAKTVFNSATNQVITLPAESVLPDGTTFASNSIWFGENEVLPEGTTIANENNGNLKFGKGTQFSAGTVLGVTNNQTNSITIPAKSTISEKTNFKNGTTFGAGTRFMADGTIASGEILPKGTQFQEGQTIKTGTILSKGTSIPSGTVLKGTPDKGDTAINETVAGTKILTEDIKLSADMTVKGGTLVAGDTGVTLGNKLTIVGELVLGSDWELKNAETNNDTSLAWSYLSNSLKPNSLRQNNVSVVLGEDVTLTEETEVRYNKFTAGENGITFGEGGFKPVSEVKLQTNAMTLKQDTQLWVGTTTFGETKLGDTMVAVDDITLYNGIALTKPVHFNVPMYLAVSSSIPVGTVVPGLSLGGDMELTMDNFLRTGSYLNTGSVLKVGGDSGLTALNHYFYFNSERLSEDDLAKLKEMGYEFAGADVNSAPVDMDDFDGKTVAVSIRAVSVTTPEKYGTGPEGDERTLDVASRLALPDMEKLDRSLKYDANGCVDQAELETNFVLTLKDEDVTTLNGRYGLRVRIGEDIVLGEDGKTYMTGTLKDSSYTFPDKLVKPVSPGNSGEPIEIPIANLAGKTIEVSLRSTSDNDISSKWSEWKEIRLPRVKLTAPEMTVETTSLSYPVFVTRTEGDAHEAQVPIETVQDTVVIKEPLVQNGGISIDLVESTSDIRPIQRRGAHLELTRTGHNYTAVRYYSGAGEVERTLQPLDDKKPEALTDAAFETLKAMGSVYELPYSVDLHVENYSDGIKEINSKVSGWLIINEKEAQVKLILPDNSEPTAGYSSSLRHIGLWTKNVLVQALPYVEPETEQNYVISDGTFRYRQGESELMASSVSVEKLPVITAKQNTCDCETVDSEVILHIETKNVTQFSRLLAEITIGDIARYFAMPVMGEVENDVLKSQLTIPNSLLAETETSAQIRVRLISPDNSELMGGWSEAWEVTLQAKPDEPEQEPEPEPEPETSNNGGGNSNDTQNTESSTSGQPSQLPEQPETTPEGETPSKEPENNPEGGSAGDGSNPVGENTLPDATIGEGDGTPEATGKDKPDSTDGEEGSGKGSDEP